jgi:hypothetical protein
VYNNITQNITNEFYAGWLTITNNITNNNNITSYVENNITINQTNVVFVENNFTNNITMNTLLNVTVNANSSTNVTLNIFNITNNYVYEYNDTAIWNELYYKLNVTDQRYNDTQYCDARISMLNITIQKNTNSINILNNTIYGELSDYDITLDTLTLTTINTYYNVTSFPNTLYNNGWYQNGNSLVCNVSGLYDIEYSLLFSINSANNLVIALFKNNAQIDKTLTGVKTSANELYFTQKSVLYRFNVNDTITIQMKNTDTNLKIVTFTTKDLHVVKVSD